MSVLDIPSAAAAGNDSRRALARLVEERILEPEAVDMLVANEQLHAHRAPFVVLQEKWPGSGIHSFCVLVGCCLQLEKGDADKALMLCIECTERGSLPSDLLRRKRKKADDAAKAATT
eukprot:scaffold161951_cov19-Tisochrysis_lutea.AAC.1